jgi:hypothetical protein
MDFSRKIKDLDSGLRSGLKFKKLLLGIGKIII